MKSSPFLWLLALVSGALIPVQAAANAALSRAMQGNVPFSALILFGVALAATLLAIVFTGAPTPSLAQIASAPWWSFVGGVIVAGYVFTITYLAPRLGVGTAVALILAGQIVAALAIDHFGLMRSMTFALTIPRVLGGLLMIAGTFLALRR